MGNILFICVLFFPGTGLCERGPKPPEIPADELERGIRENLDRVVEFRFIRETAERLGLRVWLFGGTAAGFAHYVNRDLQQNKQGKYYQRDRFDYNFVNIYRSTQDVDLVVDGPLHKAEELERIISEKFRYFQGTKSAWEVRLLTEARGEKMPLLGDDDFQNQHSDSNSVGMVEITKPSGNKKAMRDLRHWDSDWSDSPPPFVEDVREGKLEYYFSKNHETTSRYLEGKNPPIISVVRALIKVFQFELEVRPKDMERFSKIVKAFDPDEESFGYVKSWMEENGKKLYLQAENVAYAKKVLDKLGLRKKLIELSGNPDEEGSLAWWLSREPVPSFSIGKGKGRTAEELGITEVAHDTRNFNAYESITQSYTGEPNILKSRWNAIGETAAMGEGFYTRKGSVGAWGNGLTIRFKIDPRARENADFKVIGDIVLILNRAILTVIPEKMILSPEDYFMLTTSSQQQFINPGILERYRRTLGGAILKLSEQQRKAADERIAQQILSHGGPTDHFEWFVELYQAPEMLAFPKSLSALISTGTQKTLEFIVKNVFSERKFFPGFMKQLAEVLEKADRGEYFLLGHLGDRVFSGTDGEKIKEGLRSLLIKRGYKFSMPTKVRLKRVIFSTKKNIDYSPAEKEGLFDCFLKISMMNPNELAVLDQRLSELIREENATGHTLKVLLLSGASHLTQTINQFITTERKKPPRENYVYLAGKWQDVSKLASLVEQVISKPAFADQKKLIHRLIDLRDRKVGDALAEHAFSRPYYQAHPEYILRLIRKADKVTLKGIGEHVMSRSFVLGHKPIFLEWLERADDQAVTRFICDVFAHRELIAERDLFEATYRRTNNKGIMRDVFIEQVYCALSRAEKEEFRWILEKLVKEGDDSAMDALVAYGVKEHYASEITEFDLGILENAGYPNLKTLVRGVFGPKKRKAMDILKEIAEKGSDEAFFGLCEQLLRRWRWPADASSYRDIVETAIRHAKGPKRLGYLLNSVFGIGTFSNEEVFDGEDSQEMISLSKLLIPKGGQKALMEIAKDLSSQRMDAGRISVLEQLMDCADADTLEYIVRINIAKVQSPTVQKRLLQKAQKKGGAKIQALVSKLFDSEGGDGKKKNAPCQKTLLKVAGSF